MLGRRQLRAKAMQSLYAYYRGNEDLRLVEKNMVNSINDIQKLYYALLTLIIAVKHEAENKVEIGLSKNFPTEEERNPNRKFIQNEVFSILEENKDLQDFTEKNKQLDWTVENVYPAKIIRDFVEDPTYLEYLHKSESNLEDDKEILLYLYANYMADNDEILNFVEDINLSWSDDLHIANTMVMNTLKSFKSDNHKLFKLLLDQEHLEFTKELIRITVRHEAELTEIIQEKAQNWDFERIALVDRLILQMALAEFLYFPSIPPKVTINEYVEMAKNYSTPKSKTFVNGILDKSLKDLNHEGKIRKSARGMM